MVIRKLWFNKLLYCLTALYTLTAYAQTQPFRVDHIGVNEGLTQGSVYYMHKDSRNFLWLGTQDGLNRYDGNRFRAYHSNDTLGSLKGIAISGIIEDADHNLWVGTDQGLNRYDRKRDRFEYLDAHNKQGKPVISRTLPFYADEREILYISDVEGLVSLNYRTREKKTVAPWVRLTKEYDLLSSTVRTPSGDVWLHAPKGLIRYNLQERKAYHYFSDDSLNVVGEPYAVFAFFVQSDNVVWLGTDRGLIRFNPRTLTYKIFNQLGPGRLSSVFSIAQARNGQLWLGTESDGLVAFDPNKEAFDQIRTFTNDTRRLTDYEIRKVYIDNQGIIWANTDPDGLARIVPDAFIFKGFIKRNYSVELSDEEKLNNYTIRGFMEETPGGRLWVITESDISVLDPSHTRVVRRYLTNSNQSSLTGPNRVRSLYRDPQGRIWVGLFGGIMLFHPQTETFERFSFNSGFNSFVAENYVRSLVSIDANTLIAATEDGLYQFNIPTKTWTVLPYLQGQNIFSLMFDGATHQLWVGTRGNGFYRFQLPERPQERAWQLVNQGLPKLLVMHFYNDTARQTVWLATDQGLAALHRQTPDSIKLYTERNGLANSFIYGALPDGRNMLWLSTNRGLSRFDPKTETVKNFKLSDGLQGYEYNGNAFCRTANGEMFFGGVNGFNYFRPEYYQVSSFKPKAHIYNLMINDEPHKQENYVGESKEITLDHHQNTFSFEFAAIDFLSNGHNSYMYKLEGYDDDWVLAGEKNYVRYANIEPDDYVFYVKASNKDGQWSSAVRKLIIHIKPPFWATWTFRGLVLLVIGLLVYAWVRQRENRLRRQQTERLRLAFDIQEQVKRDIARDLHDEIGTRLATLKLYTSRLAQLIGDTGDIVQIKENMFSLINDTIVDVRNLLRKLNPHTLEQYGLVSAIEELLSRINATETVDAHLTLEHMPERLSPDLDLMLYRITQELINNTLKHANARHINVRLSRNDDRLLLEYTDDGVGFDYEQTRRGLGIGNIESRVTILGGRITWQTQPRPDMQSSDGRTVGTRALIEVPLGKPADHKPVQPVTTTA